MNIIDFWNRKAWTSNIWNRKSLLLVWQPDDKQWIFQGSIANDAVPSGKKLVAAELEADKRKAEEEKKEKQQKLKQDMDKPFRC